MATVFRAHTMISRALILRSGEVDDPLGLALGFLEKYAVAEPREAPRAMSFDERDLRLANRGGARISAAEIAAVLERRRKIVRALQTIRPDASLAAAATSIPWAPMTRLFDAFADIRGIGYSKMTKTLHPKRPALIPMLDSVVQAYLAGDPGFEAALSYGARATALVRSYKHDLDHNRIVLGELGQALADGGYHLTEVRLLDILIWSVSAGA